MNSDSPFKNHTPTVFVRVGETPPPPTTSQVPGLITGFAIGMLGMLAVLPFLARK